jgi:glucose-1-phosphatase
MAIRVVCFDLGGVLVKICRSIDEAAARVGLSGPEAQRWQSGDLVSRRNDVVRRYHRGELQCEAYYAELAAASADHYTAAQVRDIHDLWLWGEYPGVDHLVAQLNQVPHLTTACLSNTAHAHWQQMTESQKARYPSVNQLRVKLASHLMRMVKPDAEIYVQAAKQLSVAPAEILFFDDLAENVAAARAAGLCAEQVDHLGDTASQIAAHLQRAGILIETTAALRNES